MSNKLLESYYSVYTQPVQESVEEYIPDRFDIVFEYLISEGYVDNNYEALLLMTQLNSDTIDEIVAENVGGGSFMVTRKFGSSGLPGSTSITGNVAGGSAKGTQYSASATLGRGTQSGQGDVLNRGLSNTISNLGSGTDTKWQGVPYKTPSADTSTSTIKQGTFGAFNAKVSGSLGNAQPKPEPPKPKPEPPKPKPKPPSQKELNTTSTTAPTPTPAPQAPAAPTPAAPTPAAPTPRPEPTGRGTGGETTGPRPVAAPAPRSEPAPAPPVSLRTPTPQMPGTSQPPTDRMAGTSQPSREDLERQQQMQRQISQAAAPTMQPLAFR